MVSDQKFSPGFRISLTDIAVIVVGAAGTVMLWSVVGSLGLLLVFVVGHFFLFCNVFRVARKMELTWAGIFVALASPTILLEIPNWTVTIMATLGILVIVVLMEMRKPSYHGIGWQIINPNLRDWWDTNAGSRNEPQDP